MFTHKGHYRTLNHNLQIASLLSFVAGIVNVAGFLSIQRLTTNVTGHFAFFVDAVFNLQLAQSLAFLFYILCFLLGSFVSSILVELTWMWNEKYVFIVPALLETAILLALGLLWPNLITEHPNIIAYTLLFAMGLQNSMVTRISGAMVRTTHLTGLFTDLGIELSQLFFYREPDKRKQLLSSISLRLTIIFFFFLGGVTGGVFYVRLHLYVLLIATGILAAALVYNVVQGSVQED